MKEIRWFEEYTLWFIVPITLLVLALLIIVVIRFRAAANPVPSKTSHNTLIEIFWTSAPSWCCSSSPFPRSSSCRTN